MDSIFKDNPGLDVAYKTADGKYFYTENGAQNHALTLKNQEVKNEVVTETQKPQTVETTEPLEPSSENTDSSEVPDNSENPQLSENSDSSENPEPSEEQDKSRFELKPNKQNKR